MLESELLEIISCGETSRAQFKEKLDNPDSIVAEMAAMANCGGGQIFFGIKDRTGEPCGLSYEELQSTGNRIAAIASDFVKPQVFVTTLSPGRGFRMWTRSGFFPTFQRLTETSIRPRRSRKTSAET